MLSVSQSNMPQNWSCNFCRVHHNFFGLSFFGGTQICRYLRQQKILDSENGESPVRRQLKENPSERNETWCKNRFDLWRKQQGIDTSKSLEELPYEELGTLLSKFFLMISKDNGERYPSARYFFSGTCFVCKFLMLHPCNIWKRISS